MDILANVELMITPDPPMYMKYCEFSKLPFLNEELINSRVP